MSSLVEIGLVVLEKVFKFHQLNECILLITYNLPLEKGVALHLNTFEFPFNPGCFKLSLVKNWPSSSGELDKM